MTTYPHETPHRALSLLGLIASGDLGPMTCWRHHAGKIVFMKKTPPEKPPSLAQITGRARMNFGAEQWRNFPLASKLAWRNAAKRAHLRATGYNLWQQWYFNADLPAMLALQRQTGIPFLQSIHRSIPHLPANPKITPSLLTNPPVTGQARYARPFIIIPPSTTEYTLFLACHPERPPGEPVTAYWALYGPGNIAASQVLNMRWCRAAFTTPAFRSTTTIEVDMHFPDGSEDTSWTRVHTRDLSL